MGNEDAARWDAKYSGRPLPAPGPSQALQSMTPWLPPGGGRLLDLAGGDGGQAVWLASRGLDVTLCDVSSVALDRARQLAAAAKVYVTTRCLDLERDPLPDGPWDLVLCSNYLQLSLWSAVSEVLQPGARAIWLHPTVDNLTRHQKPSRRFLLEPGQGRATFEAAGLAIDFAAEDWMAGRHLSRLVGRKPAERDEDQDQNG